MPSNFNNYYSITDATYAIEIPSTISALGFDPNFPSAVEETGSIFTDEFLGFGSVVPQNLPELDATEAIRTAQDVAAQNLGFVRGIPDIGFGGVSFEGAESDLNFDVDPNFQNILDDVDWDAFPRGWGEPDPPKGHTSSTVFGEFNKGQKDISDNGGDVVVINADFKRVFNQPNFQGPMGPFVVTLESETTGIRYPSFSGIPTQSLLLYTTINQDKLYFCTHPMPKGRYQVNVQFRNGNGFWDRIYLNNALLVVQRNRNDATMGVRAALPSFWNAGERSDNFTPPVPYVKGSESNNAILTSAIAETTNYMIDSDYTVTTTELFPVDIPNPGNYIIQVESTKGFPPFGQVNIGGDVYDFEVKTETALVLNEYTTGQIKKRLPKGTKVNINHMEYSEIENIYKRQNFNIRKPGFEMTDTNWLAAFRRVYQGAFNTQATLFNYFFHLFRGVNVRFCATVANGRLMNVINPSLYQGIYDALPFDIQENLKVNLNTPLNTAHERRPMIVSREPIFDLNRDELYYTNGIIKSEGFGFILEPNDSAYWRGAYGYLNLNEDGRPVDENGVVLEDIDASQANVTNPNLREVRIPPVDENGEQIIYFCEILPWFWTQDSGGRFELELDDSVLNVISSMIDINFIDFDIFLDSIARNESNVVSDLGLNDLLSSGVIGRITKRSRGGEFGTHVEPNANPALVDIDVSNNFILDPTE